MRYPTSEKLEIIRIVEQSHLPAKKTLDQLGIARRTFYRWYDRYLEGGPEALEDRPSRPIRVWNRISAEVQSQIVDMALEQSELSPRELAVRFTDEKRYFVVRSDRLSPAQGRHAGRRLLRQSLSHHRTTRKDQAKDNRIPTLAAPNARRLTSTQDRGRHSTNPTRPLRQMF